MKPDIANPRLLAQTLPLPWQGCFGLKPDIANPRLLAQTLPLPWQGCFGLKLSAAASLAANYEELLKAAS